MEFQYSEHAMTTEHLMPEFPQPFMVKKEAEYELRAGVLVDGGDRFGVSSVIFDKYEELIWMGNQGGHVTSYYGPRLQKYTSFQIHMSEEVRDILTLEEGIYCLTKTSLRHQIRRGIPRHTYTSPNMLDMQCLFQVDTHKVLMGGHQDKLLELDLNKWAENVINVPEEGCAVLRSGGGSVVACGSANGMITMRDIRCPGNAEQSFRAHTGCLSDLDMQGDMLITCGFTQTSSTPVAEPYVVVWDVRCVRGSSLRQIPTVSPPQLLHFVPAVSGRAVAMASDGHVTVLDVNDSLKPESQSVFQVETNNSQCSVMDVSSTSQALVFGDLGGHIHMYSAKQNLEPVYNSFSKATEFADPLPNLPSVSFKDENFRFSSIPRPPLTTGTKWFSDMPAEYYKNTYRKLKPIDPEILRTMKMQGPIGYAPNPKTFRRNQIPYVEENSEEVETPKPKDTRVAAIQPIPRHYLKIDLRFKLPRSHDNIDVLNKAGFPGLEFTLPNSYCNAMLQVLYHIPALKATLLAHTCAKEFCLSCELGFLFRMLDSSGGAPCQANNFLRAFRTVPEAAALGLILPDGGVDNKADLITLIQSWNRFMLQQIHSEILEARKNEKELTMLTQTNSPPKVEVNKQVNGQYEEYQYTDAKYMGPPVCDDDALLDGTNNHDGGPVVNNHVQPETNDLKNNVSKSDDKESEISKLFAISRQQVNRCTKCNKEEERESVVMACALQYVANTEGEKGGFLELVRASLASRRSTPAWCEHCARFTPTVQRGRILRLPPILAINCGGVSAHEKAYWTKGVQKDMLEVTKRGSSSKPCRYGLHCARPGCRFKHPERPSPPDMNSLKSSSQESKRVLPHQLHIRLQSDGEIVIDDKIINSPTEPRFDFTIPRKKLPYIQHEEEYALSSVVVCVEDKPKNLVAYVRIPDKDDESRWFLFNDLCIVPVSPDEVVQFSSWWKRPCVLFYMNADVTQVASDDS